MNQFQPSTPRAALAASAVAFTALVLGLSIVVPASLGTDAERSTAAVLPVVQLEPITVTEQAALDGAEDVVLHETPSEASAMSTRVSARSEADAANAHCPHAKAKSAAAAHSNAI